MLYMMKSLSYKLYLKKITIWDMHKRRDNGVGASKLLQQGHQRASSVDVKIDKEDKVLILLSSLSESYDHIITTMLYGKETLILEEITSTLLSNEIIKRPNQEEQIVSGLVVTGRKGRGEG